MTIGSKGAGEVGVSSFANGSDALASGDYSHAEGGGTTASGYASHAEGDSTTASGDYSHAEGSYTTASGYYSHAEGLSTTASVDFSHAEGYGTTASGYASHAEGYGTTASVDFSHASGYNAFASNITAFAWQGSASDRFAEPEYGSHGNGTYNLNPVGGLAGLWIGEETLGGLFDEKLDTSSAIYQPTQSVAWAATTTIVLDPSKTVYMVDVTNNTTLAMDYSGIDFGLGVVSWQTWLTVASTNIAVALPSTNLVQYLETPDVSTTTANQTLQIAWQAWVTGTTTNVQANLYARKPEE